MQILLFVLLKLLSNSFALKSLFSKLFILFLCILETINGAHTCIYLGLNKYLSIVEDKKKKQCKAAASTFKFQSSVKNRTQFLVLSNLQSDSAEIIVFLEKACYVNEKAKLFFLPFTQAFIIIVK